MRIDILTLFPDAVDAMMHASILGRSFTTNKQMQVDDYPYGGGRGAVMQADPLYRCWAHVCEEAGSRGHTIYLSPCGRTFTQSVARELKETYDHLILVCGHYEGIDQRFIDECVDEEISMGDFVVTGGEIPAMALADAVCRMGAGCRTCCSPVTTATWRSGGASRATSARCCAVPTCGRSSTRAYAKPRASAGCSPRPRPRRRRCAPARSLHLPMINDRSGVPVCGRDAVFFAALFLGGARNLSSTFSSGRPHFC